MDPARGKQATDTSASPTGPTTETSRTRSRRTARNGTSRGGSLGRLLTALREADEAGFKLVEQFDFVKGDKMDYFLVLAVK